jgi:hypothetical protein
MGEAQAFVLKAIETQVKGTAAATAGGFELMKNRVSIFGQELAEKALPYLDRFGNFMIETGGPAIVRFAQNANEAANALGERMAPTVAKVSNFIQQKGVPALKEFAGWVQDHVVPAIVNYVTPALEGARQGFNQVAASVRKNGPELKDMGSKLQKIAEFILDKLAPVMGDFAGGNLKALGTAIGIAITHLSNLYKGFSDIVRIVQSAIDKVNTLIDRIQAIPGIPGEGATGHKAGSETTDKITATTTDRAVTINLYGPTDPRGAAREVERALARAGVTSGRAVR